MKGGQRGQHDFREALGLYSQCGGLAVAASHVSRFCGLKEPATVLVCNADVTRPLMGKRSDASLQYLTQIVVHVHKGMLETAREVRGDPKSGTE